MFDEHRSKRLAGRRVLVTGGTRGLGAAIATLAAAEGADVVVAGRTPPTASLPARFVAGDLATEAGCAALADAALAAFDGGGVDVLVDNAGGQVHTPAGALATPDEAWTQDLALNLLSAVRLDRRLVPGMVERGRGAVVHVGSGAARIARPQSLPYTAAKAALTAYSKGLATEVAPAGVRVNVVHPGVFPTERFEARVHERAAEQGADPADVRAAMVASFGLPLGRTGAAHELAEVVVFLASDAAAYVTGTQVTVDGGLSPTV